MIDTLTYAKTLQKSGVDPKLAKAYSKALSSSLNKDLVTKTDLKKFATKHDFRKLKDEMQKLSFEIQKSELRMTIRLGSIVVVTSGIMLALLALILKM